MGVDRTDYLMWAVDVGADAFDWDKHEAEQSGALNRRFDIVYDGMSGKYCYAGHVVARSGPYEGFEPITIDLDEMKGDMDALANGLNEAFGRDDIREEDIKLILFSHHS